MDLPKAPILFTKPRTSLADPFPAVIPIPRVAQDGTSDYEAELCVIIGKTGRNISEDTALDHVLGYTCANDVSARTAQMLTSQWCFSKGLDGSCPLGPVLVMRDVIGDPEEGLGIKAIYNGETLQDGSTK
jgi:2-keto-4-pentenoate hydratase/2-oxohepta-3-ene-1,7-dioic acid hydratase in catechol pathway